MKKIVIVILVLIGLYVVVPEDSKADIAYHAKVEKYNTGVAKFLIGTKVGRKIAYIFIRKSTKKKIRQVEREAEKMLKEMEKSR